MTTTEGAADSDSVEPAAVTRRKDRVVVVGSSSTAIRLVEELVRAGEQVTVLVHGRDDPVVQTELRALGAEVVPCGHVRAEELRRAGITTARAAAVVGDDDVVALRVALAIEELNPTARLVIELTNPELGTRLGPLLGDHVVLSSAELAAPAFVSAALATATTQTFEIAGRRVVAGPRDEVGGTELLVLGDSSRYGIDALLPSEGDIVLGTELTSAVGEPVPRSGLFGAVAGLFDRRVRVVLLGMLILILLSTGYFRLAGFDWLTALYRALTASTDTGLDTDDLSLAVRYGAVVIQLFGLVLSAGITAIIVDALISARLAALTGGVRGRPRRHVVVCGLGRIGTAVAGSLRDRQVSVVAIEHNENAPGVLWARQAKIPVIIAPATAAAAQDAAGIARAAGVLALTDDDAANLEIALVAREANPDVRLVLRLFDHELADRVERRLDLRPTRSVSMLAAPAFTAALLGRRSEVIFPVGRRVLLFTEVTVQAGSAAPGRRLATLADPGSCALLAYAPGLEGSSTPSRWTWTPGNPTLRAGDRLAVAASRAGLARLLLATKSPARP